MREKLPIIDVKSYMVDDRDFKKTIQYQKETRDLLAFGIPVLFLSTLYSRSKQSYVWTLFLLIGTGFTFFIFLKLDKAFRSRISEKPTPEQNTFVEEP